MDIEKMIYELKEIKSAFSLFSCLNEEAQIKDIAIMSLVYEEKIEEIINEINVNEKK